MRLLYTAILSACISAIVAYSFIPSPQSDHSKPKETAFERVISSKTIKCGYVIYPPTVIKDLNTGKMTGSIVDIVESAANKLDLKVEWAEELGWGNFLEGLKTGRYDVACAAGFALPPEAKNAETIGPLYYSGIGIWVREDDNRFDTDFSKINSPDVTISALDGSVSNDVQADKFPKAKILSMPTTTDYSMLLTNISVKKADVALVENYQGLAFVEKNPNTLKNIATKSPVAVFPNVILVDKGEFKLQSMLQTVINQMHNSGEIETIIKKHDKYNTSFYLLAKPYIIPE